MIVRMPRWEIGILIAAVMLGGCAMEIGTVREPASPPAAATAAEQAYAQGDFERAAQQFLQLSDEHGAERAHYRLRAAEAYREAGELDAAAQALDGLRPRRLNEDENIRFHLIQAEIALNQHAPARALDQLVMGDAGLPLPLRLRLLELRARAEAGVGDAFGSARTRALLDRSLVGADRAQNENQLLATLQSLPPEQIKQQAGLIAATDPLQPWLNQALRKSGQALPLNLMRPNQAVGTLMPDQAQREGYRPAHFVALLLPSEGGLKAVSQAVRDGFFAAYFADKNAQRAAVRVYDSGGTAAEATAAYAKATADGADRIVGPLTREAVSAVFAQGRSRVPVLALNQAEHGEPAPSGSAAFGLAPDNEAAQAAEHMLERGIHRAVVITATDDWAERAALAFRAQFESRNGQVLNEARLAEGEVNFSAMLRQTMAGVAATKNAPSLPGAIALQNAAPQTATTQESDVGVFISMRPQQARLLMPQLKLAGYNGLPVFGTSHIYAGEYNPGLDRDLDGVEFCDAPWLFDAALGLPKHSEIARTLDSARGAGARLFAMGLDAYALLPYLEWLSTHHDSYLPGATGQLAEDSQGRIQRLLVWAQFENGAAHPIAGSLTVGAVTP